MATKVARTGVDRESGYLYFLDKKGDVSRVQAQRGGGRQKRGKKERIAKAGVEREEGFLYFIDKDGDVARVKMARPGSKRRAGKAKAKPAAPKFRTWHTTPKTVQWNGKLWLELVATTDVSDVHVAVNVEDIAET